MIHYLTNKRRISHSISDICISTHHLVAVCSRALDIGLIVDVSPKVRGLNLLRVRNFLKHIVSSFTVSSRATRFGLVEFSRIPRKLFDFNRFTNQATLVRVMGRIPSMKGNAKVGRALKFAASSLFSRSPRRKIAIVITASKSFDSVTAPARLLRRAGVTLVAVGIGSGRSVTQLQQMATTRRYAFASHFKTLISIVRAIKKRACKGESYNRLKANQSRVFPGNVCTHSPRDALGTRNRNRSLISQQ